MARTRAKQIRIAETTLVEDDYIALLTPQERKDALMQAAQEKARINREKLEMLQKQKDKGDQG